MDILNRLRDELETLESLSFTKINKEQKQMLKDSYNFYTGGFEYAEDDWGNVVFIFSNDTFRNIEYYVGLEYEREHIEYKIELDLKVIVSYCGSDRIDNFYGKLKNLE